MIVFLAIICGALVGFSLGLIGGGGSILATPMMLYVLGMPPHRAIGTSSLAVSANAFLNFATHARARTVRWAPAALFAIVGILARVASFDHSDAHFHGGGLPGGVPGAPRLPH